MTVAASGIVLAFLLATAYGAAFHVIMGGPARRILLYVIAAWIGFVAGHFLGDFLKVDILELGAVKLFSASLGAWAALLIARLLAKDEPASAGS